MAWRVWCVECGQQVGDEQAGTFPGLHCEGESMDVSFRNPDLAEAIDTHLHLDGDHQLAVQMSAS